VNNSDVLPALLRMLPNDYMQQWHGMTTTYLDNYGLLEDCPGKNNNPLADYGGADHNEWRLPRGVHKLTFIKPDGAGNQIGINRYDVSGTRQDDSPISTATTDYWVIGCSVRVAEPLFVSPFLFNDPKMNNSAMLGINSLQFVMSIDSQMKRFWSSGLKDVPKGRYNLSLLADRPFENMQMYLKFLTSPLSLVLPPKSALPYMSLVPYVTSQSDNHALGVEKIYNINSLQLEVIPDRFYVYIRQRLSDQSVRSADSFLEIRKVSITFGNKSGILSSAQQEDLWKLSRRAGNQQDWYNWKGSANKYSSIAPYNASYATTGSVLVLDPSYLFGLNPYSASGSIGQYSFQMQVTAYRNVPDHPDATDFVPEIVVVAARSGMVITSSGSSTLTTNMLSAALTTEALQSDKDPMGSDQYSRLVGGASPASAMPSGGVRSGGVRSGGKSGKYSKLSALAM
jgi:hypothetical protein